jgi:uncharacterized membrane protein YidH (DUF202 family)
MKAVIVLVSILAMALTAWWTYSQLPSSTTRQFGPTFKIIVKSFVAGLVVYFVLLIFAVGYLAIRG